MTSALLLLTALAGLAHAEEPLPVPILELSNDGADFTLGDYAGFGLFGADPFTRAWLALTLEGPGAGPCGPAGLCLDLHNPTVFIPGRVGITTIRVWSLPVPAWVVGQTVCAQGVALVGGVYTKSAVECRHVSIDGVAATYGGSEYLFTSHLLTRADATTACDSVGMSLVVPGDSGEALFLQDTLLSVGLLADPWVGVDDVDAEGVFVDAGDVPVGYTPWAPGEPSNTGDEDCARQLADGTWDDVRCDTLQQVVCER